MLRSRQWIPVGGLLATIAMACYAVVQLHGQTPAPTADFTNAMTVEVRDAQGQVVLQGQFMAPVEDDDDLERHATLAATGAETDATGEAELEFARTDPTSQEVEFAVRNLPPRATFTFAIDGMDVASATTNQRGRAEVELEVQVKSSK
jgi:hypothetical protein